MKKLLAIMSLALIGLLAVTFAYAVNIPVSASVADMSPEMHVVIQEITTPDGNPWSDGITVSAMAFGTLEHTSDDGTEAGVWFSKKYFCVFAYPFSYGKKYEIKSTCTGLTSGTNSLPAGSFKVAPVYAPGDNGDAAMPSGAVLGTAGSAVAENKSIYKSEAGASDRVIQAYYALPNYDTYDGFAAIPLSQAPGSYSGTVTLTIAAY